MRSHCTIAHQLFRWYELWSLRSSNDVRVYTHGLHSRILLNSNSTKKDNHCDIEKNQRVIEDTKHKKRKKIKDKKSRMWGVYTKKRTHVNMSYHKKESKSVRENEIYQKSLSIHEGMKTITHMFYTLVWSILAFVSCLMRSECSNRTTWRSYE